MSEKQTMEADLDTLYDAEEGELDPTREKKKRSVWETQRIGIKRHGSSIILPDNPEEMPVPVAIKALTDLQEQEEKVVQVYAEFEGYPLDAALACVKAMERTFGWANSVDTPGFFGPNPPSMVNVEIGPGQYAQIPFGRFEVPGIEGFLQFDVDESGFVMHGKWRRKDAPKFDRVVHAAREILRTESIYKGVALKLHTDSDGDLTIHTPPTFINTDKLNKEELILNDDVEEMISTSVFVPVQHTQQCRTAGIPLNRGVLLEGTYGVGKTMTALMTAKVCADNGWTFLLLEDANDLAEGLLFAQRYAPAVVFCEDIDRVTQERDDAANELLNTIDGILTKDAEVIAIMTTNHVEHINKAMLRPGRLDSVISVSAPDAKSVKRLINLYSRGLLAEGETLEEVGKELAGQIPATIREVVERAKLRAIPHMNGSGLHITEQDLLHAAYEMKVHLELLNRQPSQEPTASERFTQAYADLLREAGITPLLEANIDTMDTLNDKLREGPCIR